MGRSGPPSWPGGSHVLKLSALACELIGQCRAGIRAHSTCGAGQMDGGKMMTGNAGTGAIKARSAQSAHCVVALERLSTKERNVKRNYSQNTPCSVQRTQISFNVVLPRPPCQFTHNCKMQRCWGAERNVNVCHCEVWDCCKRRFGD